MDSPIADEVKSDLKLNDQQHTAFDMMRQYIQDDNSNEVFILRGSAGTGKTTLMRSLTLYLGDMHKNFCLLAPTGRAANILSQNSNIRAKTLHSFLYTLSEVEKDDFVRMQFVPRTNYLSEATVLIVDESSMISDLPANNEVFFSVNSLLQDLISFYRSCADGSKLIFVGDTFQLPPINESSSAALDTEKLLKKYHINCTSYTLTEILRQKGESYILQNATLLRNFMEQKRNFEPILKFRNLYRPELAVSHFCKLFVPDNPMETVFLAYKNSTIHKLNRAIRKQMFDGSDQILVSNEQVVLSKTTYKNAYLTSSEIGKVISFDPNSVETVAEIQFAEAVFQFTTLSGEIIEFKSKFDLDFLMSDVNTDTPEKNKKLWADRKRNNVFFRESNNPKDDPYLSALKVKYGYAITAHKAQGGEWSNVFLYPEYPINENRLKWIYTSITRAKNEIYSF